MYLQSKHLLYHCHEHAVHEDIHVLTFTYFYLFLMWNTHEYDIIVEKLTY